MFRRASIRLVFGLMLIGAFCSQPAPSDEPARPSHLPELQYHRWSGGINVPDPVAVSVADNGDVYVTQTQRRKIQDLDIRAHAKWVPDDVGLTSVEQKRRFYHRVLAVGGNQADAAQHVKDLNQDGSLDWRDLTVISEKIHRLVDADGDGTADRTNLFAQGFQTEVTGIAAGVMHWDDRVYATIAPDVWQLTDTNADGVADDRKVIATGFGLHIAYAGHDMHGLTIGPDGKIYWSIGDKGISVVSREGRRFHFPNQGGVMRCNPDGSEFEVFAHGLRNVQEFAFDQHGNLFGVDNDSDKPGEKERFVWIVDQMDAGWRCNYQYRGDQYNPWMDENLWDLAGEQHPAYIVPPIRHYVDGPAGFKFNPGAALSADYRDFFFMTSAPNGYQYAFRCQPVGDHFQMVDSHLIGNGVPIVGLDFGPDGGLYGVDWGGGYPLNQSGSVVRIDVGESDLSAADQENRHSVKRLLNEGFDKRSDEELAELLSHVDMRVRLRSQFELATRKATNRFAQILDNTDSNQLARVHSIWGLGQIWRQSGQEPRWLLKLLNDPDPVIRKVACKTLGELPNVNGKWLIDLLEDSDLHVRVHAALALARCPTDAAVAPLLELAGQLEPNQNYLRHAITTALSSCGSAESLVQRVDELSEPARICVVVALRRRRHPAVARFLSDSQWIATEAARAIHDDLGIADAMDALAEQLDHPRQATDAMTLRMLNANYRLGTVQHSHRVIRYAADTRRPLAMRLNAIEALGSWLDPPELDRIDGRSRKWSDDRKIDRLQASKCFVDLVAQPQTELRVASVKAARLLEIELPRPSLLTIFRDQHTPDSLRLATLETLAREATSATKDLIAILADVTRDPSSEVAAAALEQLARLDSQASLRQIPSLIKSAPTPVKQAAIRSLTVNANEQSDAQLAKLGRRFADDKLPDSLKLDVWQALRTRAAESASFDALTQAITSLPLLDGIQDSKLRGFAFARDGGSASRGEKLFRTDLRAQCIRCHRVEKKGSNIGPPLTTIAKQRDADHLLRAVVYPSADIEAKYNAQSILLADGKVIQGVIKSEDDLRTILIGSDGKELEIPSDEIEAVAKSQVSLMPDMTDVLTASEVRDLVAFLRTLK